MRRHQAEPCSFSRAQYRQALSPCNAGVAEDSSRKNRNFLANCGQARSESGDGAKPQNSAPFATVRVHYLRVIPNWKRQNLTRGCVYATSIKSHSEKPFSVRKMAGATGLEPATFGVTGRHSNQLSYAPASSAQKAAREGGRCRAPTPSSQAKAGRLSERRWRRRAVNWDCRAGPHPVAAAASCHWRWDGRGD